MSKCQPPWVAPLFNLDRDMRTRVLTNPGKKRGVVTSPPVLNQMLGLWGVRVGLTKAPFFNFLIKEISYLEKYHIDSFNHIQFDKHCHSSVAGTWNLIVDHCVDKSAKLGKLRHR